MNLHPKQILVWQRVITEIAAKRDYLIYLLLALAGSHARYKYFVSKLDDSTLASYQVSGCGVGDSTADHEIHRIIKHHQKGLQKFQEALCQVTPVITDKVSVARY
ncbi:hypothetical protein BDV09DRAFT_178731 [Aspergillus tetrazonus]